MLLLQLPACPGGPGSYIHNLTPYSAVHLSSLDTRTLITLQSGMATPDTHGFEIGCAYDLKLMLCAVNLKTPCVCCSHAWPCAVVHLWHFRFCVSKAHAQTPPAACTGQLDVLQPEPPSPSPPAHTSTCSTQHVQHPPTLKLTPTPPHPPTWHMQPTMAALLLLSAPPDRGRR